ncbi:MAG: hypothetical protein RPS47_09990 [Colwellia sp.]|jgi:hypothetical protein
MPLPQTNPTVFCKAFIERELCDFKESEIWMSCWPVMARIIERAEELDLAFKEIIKEFGYMDSSNQYLPEHAYVWLILELIWSSKDFCRSQVEEARSDYNELISLQNEVVDLSEKLASALSRQSELYETSGFQRENYQSVPKAIASASKDNGHFNLYLSPELKSLSSRYDLKYWPSRSDVVDAIGAFEAVQPKPMHFELPEPVIHGRVSDIKDFVLIFDAKFDSHNSLPEGFRFSNRSMAEIINVVLDVPPEKLVSAEAVKLVRNRHLKMVKAN